MAVAAFQYDYPRPALTVDVAVLHRHGTSSRILLIQRAHPPCQGAWALPGGFVDPEEPLPNAAKRELEEETGIALQRVEPLETFGDPGRDPRGWTVSAVYFALVPPNKVEATAGDDAANVGWHSLLRPPPLAFDHAHILRKLRGRLRHTIYASDLLRPWLSPSFSLDELYLNIRALDPAAPSPSRALDRLTYSGWIEPVTGKRGTYRFRRKPSG